MLFGVSIPTLKMSGSPLVVPQVSWTGRFVMTLCISKRLLQPHVRLPVPVVPRSKIKTGVLTALHPISYFPDSHISLLSHAVPFLYILSTMTSSSPTQTSGWQLHGTGGADGGSALKWTTELTLPELQPTDVLVEFHAWSLNYPDISSTCPTYACYRSVVHP